MVIGSSWDYWSWSKNTCKLGNWHKNWCLGHCLCERLLVWSKLLMGNSRILTVMWFWVWHGKMWRDPRSHRKYYSSSDRNSTWCCMPMNFTFIGCRTTYKPRLPANFDRTSNVAKCTKQDTTIISSHSSQTSIRTTFSFRTGLGPFHSSLSSLLIQAMKMTGPRVDGTKYRSAGCGNRVKIPAARAAIRPVVYPESACQTYLQPLITGNFVSLPSSLFFR